MPRVKITILVYRCEDNNISMFLKTNVYIVTMVTVIINNEQNIREAYSMTYSLVNYVYIDRYVCFLRPFPMLDVY